MVTALPASRRVAAIDPLCADFVEKGGLGNWHEGSALIHSGR